MRKCFFLFLLLAPVLMNAQTTQQDSIDITAACKNYVEGFYRGDSVRVAKAVHPELVKRIVVQNQKIDNMSSAELISAAGRFKAKDPNPAEPFKITVTIYDVSKNIALAKITTNKMGFFDYVQMAKFGQEWKVVNVLWALSR